MIDRFVVMEMLQLDAPHEPAAEPDQPLKVHPCAGVCVTLATSTCMLQMSPLDPTHCS